jgi:KDO2-lipid IV(A) lauroyltransferase
MTYQFLKLLSWLSRRLSRARQRSFGRLLGTIAWIALSSKRKQIAMGNIESTLAVHPEDAYKIAKISVTRIGQILIDMFNYSLLSNKNIDQVVRITGLEVLENALSLRRGVILASGHCGNWELLGKSLDFYGYPMVAVVRKQQQNNGFERFLSEYRVMGGGKILYTDDTHAMVRALKENRILLILFDQEILSNGVWVNFLCRKTSAPPGVAVLARITNAPIVPAFITESLNGTHELQIYPPISVDKDSDKAVAVKETLQTLYKILEQHIHKYPHEWFWIHDRWRPLKNKAIINK